MTTILFDGESFQAKDHEQLRLDDWRELVAVFTYAADTLPASACNSARRLIAIVAPEAQARTADWPDEKLMRLFMKVGDHVSGEGGALGLMICAQGQMICDLRAAMLRTAETLQRIARVMTDTTKETSPCLAKQ